MAILTTQSGSANEKNVEEHINDIREWNKRLQTSSEEITFLNQFVSADIFQQDLPNLYEHLFTFSNTLTALKTEKIDLHQVISNHKNDINGMLECEDISCESFYSTEHKKLENRLIKFLNDLDELQVDLFKFCTNKLRMSK
ncbi:hypothetical protein [Gillisia hiemivivida]|jgi:hypothetical protein|uniref:Uncharacterized protein n=1 Tax=Gillisia hiemivivida TaxID=291190 RepID=A0A5C6ZQH7_9FLAO|nr:hypothetical protein [Gillisia hiemivivida]TXD92789.1 hypothetical protein ES724_12735 [Gillisia hiemivivida]